MIKTCTLKWLFFTTFWLLPCSIKVSLSATLPGDQAAPEAPVLRAWVYNIYNSTTTVNKFKTLFQLDHTTPYRSVDITPSIDIPLLYRSCSKHKFELLFVPGNVVSELEKRCQYRSIFSEMFTPRLFVNVNEQKPSMKQIRRIGVLSNSPVIKLVKRHLKKFHRNAEIIPFSSGQALLFALIGNKVDGIVSTDPLLDELNSQLRSGIEGIYNFKSTVSGHVLVSPEVTEKRKTYILSQLSKVPREFLSGNK